MSEDPKEQAARLKSSLQDLLRRVPASVLRGSHGLAVDYKKVAAQAHKLLATASPRLAALQQVHNQLSVFS